MNFGNKIFLSIVLLGAASSSLVGASENARLSKKNRQSKSDSAFVMNKRAVKKAALYGVGGFLALLGGAATCDNIHTLGLDREGQRQSPIDANAGNCWVNKLIYSLVARRF